MNISDICVCKCLTAGGLCGYEEGSSRKLIKSCLAGFSLPGI